ncbi:MAG TPA: site-2 protease family protein [Candidatus Kapabacteria bacterium]|nr:site-2 protease family protein [Candidatus Kapabacteria bacterium]
MNSEEAKPRIETRAEEKFLDRLLGKQRLWLHVLLFVLTYFTTTLAGEQWRGVQDVGDLANLHLGFEYATLILLFLTAHEFGHFIAARIHGVDATLPFYIPFPGYQLGTINFGTFGAVIRTRSQVPSNKVMFDIGVAGPIAGFIACIGILAVGFATLPGIGYLQQIHPGFPNVPQPPGTIELSFGNTLFFSFMQKLFVNPHGYMPPMSEVYHYPMLCAGWFGVFVTALNLLPIGQLDGGHLTYTLLGRSLHKRLGQLTALVLFVLSLPAVLTEYLNNPPAWLRAISIPGGETWLLWALLTTFVIRFRHPPSEDESPLDLRRKIIGYITIGIFIVCFTPSPLIIQ